MSKVLAELPEHDDHSVEGSDDPVGHCDAASEEHNDLDNAGDPRKGELGNEWVDLEQIETCLGAQERAETVLQGHLDFVPGEQTREPFQTTSEIPLLDGNGGNLGLFSRRSLDIEQSGQGPEAKSPIGVKVGAILGPEWLVGGHSWGHLDEIDGLVEENLAIGHDAKVSALESGDGALEIGDLVHCGHDDVVVGHRM